VLVSLCVLPLFLVLLFLAFILPLFLLIFVRLQLLGLGRNVGG